LATLTEPLQSGLTWERDPDVPGLASNGRSLLRWLRSVEQPVRRVLFKTPDPKRSDVHPNELYCCGMERVTYRFGEMLGLPVPEVWLERVDREDGCLCRHIVDGRDLPNCGKAIVMLGNIENDARALGVAFDLWLANVDRRAANLMFEPMPPGTRAVAAQSSKMWLIDNGCGGLFPPRKFGAPDAKAPPESVDVGSGDMHDDWERLARVQMPPIYKNAFLSDVDAQQQAVDRVRGITDDAIETVLHEITEPYMNGQQIDKTVKLLKLRRDRLETLVSSHW
jgi:hypothetical protein